MTPVPDLTFDPLSPNLTPSLAGLPESHGIYAFQSPHETLHLSWSANIRRRLSRLLDSRRPAGLRLAKQLGERSARIECWLTGAGLETSLPMYALATALFPDEYLDRLRLRMPWFVAMTTDAYPRLAVTNRLPLREAVAVGPFANRELASRYEEAALSLFQIRRCTETLHPQPDHPGCIYGEMNLCLRPCQLHVSADEYRNESARVTQFLSSKPEDTLASLSAARSRAAEQLDFEWAAQLHKQIEKVKLAATARPEVVQSLDQFYGVAVSKGCLPHEYRLRPMLAGFWHEAVALDLSLDTLGQSSLDARIREALSNAPEQPWCSGNRLEHLALFARWYYSSSRSGEWFPFHKREGYPYRKLARGLSKLYKSESIGSAMQ